MTENSEPFAPTDRDGIPQRKLTSEVSEQSVTLQIPLDLMTFLQQRSQQLGQTPTEVILALLRAAAGLATKATAEHAATQSPLAAPQALQTLEARLAQLEALIPRLEVLEGKWNAF